MRGNKERGETRKTAEKECGPYAPNTIAGVGHA